VSSESNIGSALWRGGRAGAVAASAVTGALLGFGLRGGMAARPFNAAAIALVGDRARGVWGFVTGVSAAGELVIVVSCVLAGALCAAVLQLVPSNNRVRHPRLFAFSLALTAAVATLLLLVARAPDFVSASPGGALSISEGVVLSLVVAAAYASGMGLAR
jgi:LytS/YehU family sensor histidine kinase